MKFIYVLILVFIVSVCSISGVMFFHSSGSDKPLASPPPLLQAPSPVPVGGSQAPSPVPVGGGQGTFKDISGIYADQNYLEVLVFRGTHTGSSGIFTTYSNITVPYTRSSDNEIVVEGKTITITGDTIFVPMNDNTIIPVSKVTVVNNLPDISGTYTFTDGNSTATLKFDGSHTGTEGSFTYQEDRNTGRSAYIRPSPRSLYIPSYNQNLRADLDPGKSITVRGIVYSSSVPGPTGFTPSSVPRPIGFIPSSVPGPTGINPGIFGNWVLNTDTYTQISMSTTDYIFIHNYIRNTRRPVSIRPISENSFELYDISSSMSFVFNSSNDTLTASDNSVFIRSNFPYMLHMSKWISPTGNIIELLTPFRYIMYQQTAPASSTPPGMTPSAQSPAGTVYDYTFSSGIFRFYDGPAGPAVPASTPDEPYYNSATLSIDNTSFVLNGVTYRLASPAWWQ